MPVDLSCFRFFHSVFAVFFSELFRMIVKGVFDYAPSSFRRFSPRQRKSASQRRASHAAARPCRAWLLLHESDLFRRVRHAQRRQRQQRADFLRCVPPPDLLAHPRGDRLAALGRAAQRRLSLSGLVAHLRAAQSLLAVSDCDAQRRDGAFSVRVGRLCRFDSHGGFALSRRSAGGLRSRAVSARSRRGTAWRARSGRRAGAGSLRARFLPFLDRALPAPVAPVR